MMGFSNEKTLALQGSVHRPLKTESDDEAGVGLMELERVTSIGGGTDQIQCHIIAERMLGRPKEPEN